MGKVISLKTVFNKVKFYLKALLYVLNLFSAIIVFNIYYKQKAEKGLITMGSSNGKFCDDNVIELYRFLIESKEKVFYVIDKDSPDLQKVSTIAKPIIRFSFKANLMVLRSEVIIYDTSFVDLIRCNKKHLSHIKTINIFHGIHGLKKVSAENAEKRVINDDYIIATSKHEANIKKEWGFNNERIFLTGLPRYDALLRENNIIKKENVIFYMPTWRPWFKRSYLDTTNVEIEHFNKSTYFKEIMQIAASEELNRILKENNYKLEIYIHKLMHRYIKNMDIKNKMSNIIFLGEKTNIQHQLIKSKLLITDYSSVFFDFLFLKKPVILYQFDKVKYYKNVPGSYIDESEISNLTVTNFDELLERINKYVKVNQYKEDNQSKLLVRKYIEYEDQKNCYRVYQHINSLMKK